MNQGMWFLKELGTLQDGCKMTTLLRHVLPSDTLAQSNIDGSTRASPSPPSRGQFNEW